MPDADAALTAYISSEAGHLPIADVLMIWISAVGVPVLVLAAATQWWVPRSDRATQHVLVAAGSITS